MEPKLRDGSHILIDTLAYDFRVAKPGLSNQPFVRLPLHPVARGDVVAFVRTEAGQHRLYLKRVVGLPGDTLAIAHGQITVDGKALPERYVTKNDASNMVPLVVPMDALFVVGDNRTESDDSREFGPVPITQVVGRATSIVWPISHVARII